MGTTPDVQRNATAAGGSIVVSGVSNVARGYRVTGSDGATANVTTPSAGQAIDGVTYQVTGQTRFFGIAATPGMPVQVEAGGSFSDGGDLEVDGNGRFVTASTGTVVARALEDAVASQSVVWAVFT